MIYTEKFKMGLKDIGRKKKEGKNIKIIKCSRPKSET